MQSVVSTFNNQNRFYFHHSIFAATISIRARYGFLEALPPSQNQKILGKRLEITGSKVKNNRL